MNASNAKDYLPLVQALADGKLIQYKYQKSDKSYAWMDLESAVDFCMPAEFYRIKPEPREIWMNYYPNGAFGQVHDSEVEAYEARSNDTAKQVCYREVI